MKKKRYLLLEFCGLFIGVPLMFFFDLVPIPKITALLGLTLVILFILWVDEDCTFSQLFNRPDEASPVYKLG
ncbi:MAG: hypothetical protein U5K69_28215 [Balneolaceae bacterium]|nr:hypothetical protein [Balneolaceae bacterium]